MKNILFIFLLATLFSYSQGTRGTGEMIETSLQITGDWCDIRAVLLNKDSTIIVLEMSCASRLAKRAHYAILDLNTLKFIGEFKSEKWSYIRNSYFYNDSLVYIKNGGSRNTIYNLNNNTVESNLKLDDFPNGIYRRAGWFPQYDHIEDVVLRKGKAVYTFKLIHHNLFWGKNAWNYTLEKPAQVHSRKYDPCKRIITPKFVHGIDSLNLFVKKNISYPEWEKENKISGTIYVDCFFDIGGKISDLKVANSVDGSKNFENEAIRVVRLLHDWIPGTINDEPTGMRCSIPITFRLKE